MTQDRPGKFIGTEVFIDYPGALENGGNPEQVQWSPDGGVEEHGTGDKETRDGLVGLG